MNVWIEISASNYLEGSRTRKKSAKVIDLIWPQLTSVDLHRTGWPVECLSTTWYYMSTLISLAKTAMFASYVPRNAFYARHDPSYDVMGQMLGGQNLEIFRGDVKRWAESYRKNGDIRPVNNKDITEKRRGCINPPPPPPVPARVRDNWTILRSRFKSLFFFPCVISRFGFVCFIGGHYILFQLLNIMFHRVWCSRCHLRVCVRKTRDDGAGESGWVSVKIRLYLLGSYVVCAWSCLSAEPSYSLFAEIQ